MKLSKILNIVVLNESKEPVEYYGWCNGTKPKPQLKQVCNELNIKYLGK